MQAPPILIVEIVNQRCIRLIISRYRLKVDCKMFKECRKYPALQGCCLL